MPIDTESHPDAAHTNPKYDPDEDGDVENVDLANYGGDADISQLWTASRVATHIVYREDGTVYADGQTDSDSYSGSTLDVVLDAIASNLGAEEYATIWIVADSTHYEIANPVELSQRVVVYARNASIDVNADLTLYAELNGGDWMGVSTATPEWYGGRFYVDAANATVSVEDFISGVFDFQLIQPTSGGASGSRADLLRITTRDNFGAFWQISGTVNDTNRDTSTSYDYLNLVSMPAGGGDGNVGARGRLDLILDVANNGSNNRAINVGQGAVIYDVDQAHVTAFVEGANDNHLIYSDGQISGVEWQLSGEGYNGANLITGGTNAAGQLEYSVRGMTGDFNAVDPNWSNKPSTHGNTAVTNGYGSIDVGTGGSYGTQEDVPMDQGANPSYGVKIGGSFGTETLTVRFTHEYQDGTTNTVTRTYTATTSSYEWLTGEEEFQVSAKWKQLKQAYIDAKVDESSTDATVDYHSVAHLYNS